MASARSALFQIAAILFATSLATAWTYFHHPRRPALYLAPERPPESGIGLEMIRSWPDPPVWIDTRDEQAYAIGHLPGALSLPPEKAAERIAARFELLTDRRRHFVLYGPEENLRSVMERLRGLGLTRVHRLRDDWRSIEAARP